MSDAAASGGRRPPWKPWLGVAAAAVLLAAAFPPVGWWPLALVALAPWAVAVHDATAWQAARRSYVFGILSYALGGMWVTSVDPVAIVALPPVAGLYWLPMGPAAVWLRRRYRWPLVLVVPLVWLTSEWFRQFLALGFPYLFLGYPLGDAPRLAQVAALGGVAAVSGLCAAFGGLVADAWCYRRALPGAPSARALRLGAGITGGLWTAAALYGLWVFPTDFEAGPVVVGVQGNIPLFEKQRGRSEDTYLPLSRAALQAAATAGAPADLLAWPETMAPYVSRDPEGMRRMQALAARAGCPFLFGTVASGTQAEPPQRRRWNSLMLMAADGRPLQRYDKIRLVVPTEWLPTARWLPGTERIMTMFTPWVPDFRPGERTGTFVIPGRDGRPGWKAGGLICYEIAYPSLARSWVNQGATALINCTNEGWFPDSAEFAQLWQIARFRAIETRTSVVRVANTGWSGCIAPNGVEVPVQSPLPAPAPAVLGENAGGPDGTWFRVAVPKPCGHSLYLVLGDWLGSLVLAFTLAALASAWHLRRRERRAAATP